MKKVGLILIALMVLIGASFADAPPSQITVIQLYTDIGSASGQIVDSAAADTSYFLYPNPILDSMIVYFFQDTVADSGSATTSGKMQASVDNCQQAVGHMADLPTARTAKWVDIGTVWSNNTTENTMYFYGIGDSTAMSNPGRWGRIIVEGEGVVERLGVMMVPKTR